MRGEEDGVDGAGGNAGDDLESEVGEVAGQTFDDADLVGGARAAAGEHDGEIAASVPAALLRSAGRAPSPFAAQPFQTVRQARTLFCAA